MHTAIVCHGPGQFVTSVDGHTLSELRQQTDTTIWLNLVAPDANDLRLLREEFDFHPLALEDASRPSQRPKVESYGSYYFVVFYCLDYADSGELCTTPLYMFVGKNYLVTIQPAPIAQIDETLSRWQSPDSPLHQDVGSLIYALLDAIVDDYFPVIDNIAERADTLEDAIFGDFDAGALQEIFKLKKDLLNLRRVVAPERDVLNVLLRRDIPVFGQDDIMYLQDVYDHIIRTTDAIDTYRDLLASALDTYLSVQSNQLNLVVKALTITSIVLMSAALVAGIYGMNFDYMPELHWRYGYLWALGLMVAIAGCVIMVFKRLKWL